MTPPPLVPFRVNSAGLFLTEEARQITALPLICQKNNLLQELAPF